MILGLVQLVPVLCCGISTKQQNNGFDLARNSSRKLDPVINRFVQL